MIPRPQRNRKQHEPKNPRICDLRHWRCPQHSSRQGIRPRGLSRPEAPPKRLIIEKVKSGIDGLITTLRDPIGCRDLRSGAGHAEGGRAVSRWDSTTSIAPTPTSTKSRSRNTADVLTEATAEFAFFLMGALARKLWPAEHLTRENRWGYWHPYLPFLGDEVTGKDGCRHWHGPHRAGVHQEVRGI